MDLSNQYQQQHHHLQHEQQTYDPSQVQAYDQSNQAYYAYNQQNQYYTHDYANAYQQQQQQQQSQQEPSSIHPPGVPILPEPTHTVRPQQGMGQTHVQNPYYPQGVADQQQQQQLNSSDSAVTVGMNSATAAAVAALSQLTQFAGNMDAAQRAMVGVSQQQWQGNSGGFGPVAMHGGSRPPIGQTPYTGGGRRGGRHFRGGGPGHFGSRPDGSGTNFRGRGRGRGRGGHFSAPADKPVGLVQGESSQTPGAPGQHLMPPLYVSGPGQAPFAASPHARNTPVWPPPRMAWCELCRVDCNTREILEQHKNGKKHKKNLQAYEDLQKRNNLQVGGQNKQVPIPEVKQEVSIPPEKVEGSEDKRLPVADLSAQVVTDENKVETEQQKVSEAAEEPARKPWMDHFEGRGRGFKRKMRGGRGGKWMRTYEGSRRPIEPPKRKQVIPMFCELCNAKCDSQVVFDSHLIGKKHLSNLKRFQGHQAILEQAALQALYPALEALYPALQALYPSNPNAATSFAPTQFHQGVHGSQGIFSQPVPLMFPPGQASATTSVSAPPPVLGHQDPKPEHARVTSETGSQDAATVEAKTQQQPISVKPEVEPAATTVEPLHDTGMGAEQVLSSTATGEEVTAIPE